MNDGLLATTTRSIVGDPFNPSYRQYTRTVEGNWPKIYRRTGGDWSVILDAATIQIVTGKTIQTGTLTLYGPTANMNAQGHVYSLASFYVTGDKTYLYFLKSVNYGDGWTAVEVSSGAATHHPRALRVGAFQGSSPHAAGQVIYVAYLYSIFSDWGMKVSVNQGGAWGGVIPLAHCFVSGGWVDLSRSAADQDVIYQVGYGTSLAPAVNYTFRKSTTRGNSWSILWNCAQAPPTIAQRPNVYIWDPDSAFMAAGVDGLHWTENDWAAYVTHTNTDSFDVDGCSRVMDYPNNLYGWQTNNPGGGDMQDVIAVSSTRGDQWEGKAGDDPITPSASSIPNNCGGVAGILQVWI